MLPEIVQKGKALKILPMTHEFLRRKITTRLEFPLSRELRDLILLTGQTLKGDLEYFTGRALGISANQVGMDYRFFVMQNLGFLRSRKLKYVLNPSIVYKSEDLHETEEGCLSMGEILAFNNRSKKIRVEYQDLDGRPVNELLEGTESFVFQHEVDHLNGILMTDNSVKQVVNDEYVEYYAKLKGRLVK